MVVHQVAQQSLAETSRDKKHLAAERKELSGAKKQLEGELGKTTQQLTTVRGRAEQLKEQVRRWEGRATEGTGEEVGGQATQGTAEWWEGRATEGAAE